MKFVISSYNKNKDESITLFDYTNNNIERLDGKCLDEPSFVISYKDIVFTYDKDNLKLVSFKVKNNKLELISEILVPLKTLTHLAYNSKHNKLYGASYADGAYLICDCRNGLLSNLKCFYHDNNSKCHCVTISPDEEKVLIANISLDKLYIYDYNLNFLDVIDLPIGVGPRHAIWNRYIYLITEYSNEVYVIDYTHEKYIILQKIKTLKEDMKSFGATLLFSNDKKQLYASNRGEDTIAIFNISQGLLEYKVTISCYGKHPRHMILTENDLIISCNRNSNNIAIINNEHELIKNIEYNNVSCVAEIKT